MYVKNPLEKKAYLQGLRDSWKEAKALSETSEMKAAYEEARKTIGGEFSITSFALIKHQMVSQGLEGTPYVDMKTFDAWKKSGYIVKKGQKSTVHGVTWMKPTKKDEFGKKVEDDDRFLFPKGYSLFHISQVEELAI